MQLLPLRITLWPRDIILDKEEPQDKCTLIFPYHLLKSMRRNPVARNQIMLITILLMREDPLQLAAPVMRCGQSNALNAGINRTIPDEEEPKEMLAMHPNLPIPSLGGLCFSFLVWFELFSFEDVLRSFKTVETTN